MPLSAESTMMMAAETMDTTRMDIQVIQLMMFLDFLAKK